MVRAHAESQVHGRTHRGRGIFTLTGTNSGYVEWEVDTFDREGREYHATGVTRFRVEGGKIRHAKDYIFDQDVVAAAFPPKDADVAESSARTAQ